MALIKLGSVVTQISGKVGGQQFGQNAGGHYMKNNGTPRKSLTLKQQKQMAVMSYTAQRWRTLIPMQRTAFNQASPEYPYINRVGETKYHSGYAIFAMLHNNKIISSVESTGVPIPLPKISFPEIQLFMHFDSVHTVDVDITGTRANHYYRLFASRPTSIGVSNSYQNQFIVADFQGSQGDTQRNITTEYQKVFGPIRTGLVQYFSLTVIDIVTGQSLRNVSQDIVYT